MLITELKSKETIEGLVSGKVFIINCHGCKEVFFPEHEADALQKEMSGVTGIFTTDYICNPEHLKLRLEKVALCFFGALVVPSLLSAMLRILAPEGGRYLILIPCVLAFLSDTGAYFIGCRFGKHKLAPVISPNKSVEGLIGGLGFAVSWWVSGLGFDISHCAGNFVIALLLFVPLRELLTKLYTKLDP